MSGVHLLGIRHHGPGSARAVRRALDALAPDVVAVELPAESEAALGFVGRRDLEPPVAVLGYVVDRPARAAFLPFAVFSPEWVALRWAAERGVPVRAIDLPFAHSLVWEGDDGLRGVDPLGTLAAAAGYDDAERWWEDVVEHRAVEVERAAGADGSGGDDEDARGDEAPSASASGSGDGGAPRREADVAAALAPFLAVAEAMAAVRAGAPAPTGEEAAREAAMRRALRGLGRDPAVRTVAVVCGAWHVPALAPPWPSAAADAAALRDLPKAKVAVSWVPWTNRRLAISTGYSAGVSSPGWYAHVFAHPGPEGVTRWFTDAARLLRSRDHPVSPDHLIGATRLANAVAALRERPVPGLSEVMDAAHAVLTDGHPGPLALIHDALVVGDALGRVPDDVPMVPLARDLAATQKRLRLKPEAGSRTVELDLRTDAGRARSHLLHRLGAIGVPWGSAEEGRGSSGTFRETWRLHWEPELAIRLVEASALGTTVVAAAGASLRERASGTDVLADLTALVEEALLADLPDVVSPLVARLAARAADDADVAHLMDALGPLARARRYGDVRATDTAALGAVIDGLVARVVVGVGPACGSLDEDAAAAMADRLTAVQAALALLDHPARRTSWPAELARLAARDRGPGVVAGRATRLVYDAGAWDAAAVERRLSRALSVGTPARDGAAFVEGFLAGSGTVLVHDATLLAVVDAWLATLGADVFGDVVPLLRRTFGAFAAAERRQIGQLLAGRRVDADAAGLGWDLDPARVDAALATMRLLLGDDEARWPG